MADKWKVWKNRLGRVKGIAIVHRASDYGLELHTALSPEHREEFCQRLCDKLNSPDSPEPQKAEP